MQGLARAWAGIRRRTGAQKTGAPFVVPGKSLHPIRSGHEMITRAIAERESAWAQRPMFVPADPGSPNFQGMLNAWRRGDAELLLRVSHQVFRDFP